MKIVPYRVREYMADHPGLLVALCGGLVAFNLLNLYDSMELLVKARAVLGEAQKAASEALGG